MQHGLHGVSGQFHEQTNEDVNVSQDAMRRTHVLATF